MKKIILALLILFTITSLHADKIERDKNDPLQNLKIGDKFTISKTSTDTETTFDFTGLGLDDSLADKITFYISYFESDEYFSSVYSITISFKENTAMWYVSEPIENIKNNFFKQTIQHTKENSLLFEKKIKNSVVMLTYFPKTISKKNSHHFTYILKELNDGTGNVEVVGYRIVYQEGTFQDGDINFTLP